jgi:hypothetical protein
VIKRKKTKPTPQQRAQASVDRLKGRDSVPWQFVIASSLTGLAEAGYLKRRYRKGLGFIQARHVAAGALGDLVHEGHVRAEALPEVMDTIAPVLQKFDMLKRPWPGYEAPDV